MNDYAVDAIHGYIANLKVPVHTITKKAHFKQDSYRLWAAYDILRLVEKYPNRRPIELIEDYRYLMNELSCQNPRTSFIFSVAYDVAEDILDLFL
jgi:hypothetical protein